MSKRKYTDIKELVGTVYNNFKIIDYKRENRRSLLFVECPHCHNRKWMRKEQIEITKSCGCLNYKTFFKAQNIKGKAYHLGRYNTIEQAAAARKQAEEELYKPILEKYNYKSNKEN